MQCGKTKWKKMIDEYDMLSNHRLHVKSVNAEYAIQNITTLHLDYKYYHFHIGNSINTTRAINISNHKPICAEKCYYLYRIKLL